MDQNMDDEEKRGKKRIRMEEPRITFDDRDAEAYMEKYSSRVEQYRKNNDIMWKLMSGKEKEAMRYFLRGVCSNLRTIYGSPNSPRRLSEESLAVFEWVTEHSEGTVLMHGLWFFALYLLPGLAQWMISGNEGNPPPPLPNPQGFQYFVRHKLPKFCDELLSGKGGMDVESFVRFIRAEYFTVVGIAECPNQLRREFEERRSQASRSDEGNSIVLIRK